MLGRVVCYLTGFVYFGCGANFAGLVRHSAKELSALIMDEERLRSERANRGSWKSRVTGLEEFGGHSIGEGITKPPRSERPRRNTGENDNDLEYRLALEASKNEAEADAARRKGAQVEDNDDDLAKALKLSKEEEELRARALDDQNQEDLLFDATPTEQVAQPTGFNQGYQQQPQVDWYGNPIGMQPQQTGYLNNAYNQPTGQNGYGSGYGGYNQPQQTGFDQLQQPSQQFLQPQNTYNPWAQQMNSPPAAQPVQEQPTAQPGSNNPWSTPNQNASSLAAQPTGSNNPFATQRPQTQPSPFSSKAPTLSTLAEQQTSNNFNQRPNPIQNYQSTPSPVPQQQARPPPAASPLQQQQTQAPQDPYQARLNALLSSGEGQDTFGNVGDLRIPAQHTAPGTFVNSAGGGSMGRLESSRTGTNPFFTQNSAAQTQYPAQTGPVGFGGSSNPFGSRAPGQQQQQPQGQQGGSLIDL